MNTSIEYVLKEVEDLIVTLTKFLQERGVSVSSTKIADLLAALERLQTVDQNKTYISVQLDKNGYVKLYNKMDALLQNQDIPDDLIRGYYKIKKNKPFLDKKRQEQLWRD